MKIKIFSFMFCFLLLISVLTISTFALIPDEYGPNFDTSHNNNHCCEDTDGVHYNQGYEDGLLDGKPSQEEIDSWKQEAIESYLTDEEYLNSLFDYYNEAYIEGQNSKQHELETQLDKQYQDGFNIGYEAGYNGAYDIAKDQNYALGVADGKADFRQGDEYKNTLQAYKDNGYEKGYLDGHDDGYQAGKGNSINPTALFGIIFTIISLFVILLALSYFTSKRKKRK